MKCAFFSFLFVLNTIFLSAQVTGTVYDKTTKLPLPFCNVTVPNSSKGTMTDIDGNFKINTKIKSNIVLSFIGYEKKVVRAEKKNMLIFLNPKSVLINEIKVVMGVDPAVGIIKTTIKNKSENISDYSSSNLLKQEKLKVVIKDRHAKLIGFNKSKLYNKMNQESDKGIPFFISNEVSFEDSIIENEIIGVGLELDFLSEYVKSLNFNFDINDDLINILGRSFVSPLSSNAFSFYKFYLVDSSYIGNNFCYKIRITKRRKRDAVFTGDIWISKSNFAAQKVNLFINDNDLNHMTGLSFSQEFNSSSARRFETSNHIQFTLNSTNLPLPDSIYMTIVKEINRIEEFSFEKTVSKTKFETNLLDIQLIDSLNSDQHIKVMSKLSEIFITSYYSLKRFDVGPLYSVYSKNKLEGSRVSFLYRSNKNLFKDMMFSNYYGYGFSDHKLKYGIQFKIRDKEKKSLQLKVNYKNDLEGIGDRFIYQVLFPNRFNASGSDVLSSIFSNNNDDKLLYIKEKKITIQKEWDFLDLSLSYTNKDVLKNENVLIHNNYVESSFDIRLQYSKTKKVKNHFDRYNVRSTSPRFYASFTYSDKEVLNASFNMIKAKAIIRQNVSTPFFGRSRYLIDLGYLKIDNDVPFSLLEVHRGNDSFIFDISKSTLMNSYEFVSDRYAAIYFDQHLNGRFLKYLPLINKLDLNEIITGNIIIGNMHNTAINNLPKGTTALRYNEPYAEVGVGLENIFKVIRINAIWRLSHLENKDISRFGLVFGVYISL